eukprot:COSAG04_NODE_29161_length_270_cov_6.748538_1_plen_76_part_01
MMASERERLSSEEAMESLRLQLRQQAEQMEQEAADNSADMLRRQLQAQTERMEADAMRRAVRKLHDIKRVSAFAAW